MSDRTWAPTWNYAVVHAHGTLRFIEDRGWLRAFVERLTDRHEAAAVERDLAERPPAQEGEPLAVGREEREAGVVGTLDGDGRPAVEVPPKQQLGATRRSSAVHQSPAIGAQHDGGASDIENGNVRRRSK